MHLVLRRPLCLLLAVAVTATARPAADFEAPPALAAADVLPPELLVSAHHSVRPTVRNDGFLNCYVIDSAFGEFEVEGGSLLRARVREIEVLAQLEELSRTEVFARAAIEAGLSPVTAIIDFGRRPVRTIVGIPGGIARLFKRYVRRARRGVETTRDFVTADGDEQAGDDSEDAGRGAGEVVAGATGRFLGVSGAERRWHGEFGTDPYTSNDMLAAAIRSVAWADRLGRFGLRFASLPAVPGAGMIGEATSLVWSTDPYELEQHNRALLAAAGADEALVEAFFAAPALTPTWQTALIAVVEMLGGVAARELLLQRAVEVESEPEARLLVESALLLLAYHRDVEPLQRLLPDMPLPSALTEGGTGVVAFAVDYLVWTEDVAELMETYSGSLEHAGSQRAEYWSAGATSPAARRELEQRGWAVYTQVSEPLQRVPPDPAGTEARRGDG